MRHLEALRRLNQACSSLHWPIEPTERLAFQGHLWSHLDQTSDHRPELESHRFAAESERSVRILVSFLLTLEQDQLALGLVRLALAPTFWKSRQASCQLLFSYLFTHFFSFQDPC